jgi:hypothetical protein
MNVLTLTSGNDGHKSMYPRAFLARAAFPEQQKALERQAWKQ